MDESEGAFAEAYWRALIAKEIENIKSQPFVHGDDEKFFLLGVSIAVAVAKGKK